MARVEITMPDDLVAEVDELAGEQFEHNRSKAVRHAVRELIQKYGDDYGAQEARDDD